MTRTSINGGSIRVLWDAGDTAEVTITNTNGAAVAFTVDDAAVTFPYTLSASTTFTTAQSGTYEVSVTHHGIEIANTPDGTRIVRVKDGSQEIFSPTPDANTTQSFLEDLFTELSATYGRRVTLDVRNYGDFAEGSAWQVNRDAMQAANDAAVALGGADVTLPPGVFQVKGVYQDSHVTFRGNRTTLMHPDGLSGHMIEARNYSTTGSIASGSFDLTVASAANIEEGTVVAITAAGGLSNRQSTLLTAAIDSTQTTGITLADPSGFPVSGYMMIGSEVVAYTGLATDTLTGVTRGQLGTTAAAHGITGPTDAVGVASHHIAQVVTVNGTTVTLDRTATFTVTNAPVTFGVVDPGIYDLRFEGNRQSGAQVFYPVSWTTTGNGHGDNIYAHDAQSAFFIGLGTTGCKFGTITAEKCRLTVGVGAAFWMFQSCRRNSVEQIRVEGEMFIGVYIDDRTTAASPFDGPGEDNHVGHVSINIPVTVPMNLLTENTIGVLVSGGLRNSIGSISASGVRTGVVFENGGQWQSWDNVPPDCKGNVVAVFRGKDLYQPWVISAPGNGVVDARYDSYLTYGDVTGNPTLGFVEGPGGAEMARFPSGTSTRPAISFRSDSDTGFYLAADGIVYFVANAALVARLWSTGIRMEASKHITWGTDNTGDIGQNGSQRPRHIYAAQDVRAARVSQAGAFATASRPAPATAGAGGMVFDTTLNKPVWSDGTNWRDATGTIV